MSRLHSTVSVDEEDLGLYSVQPRQIRAALRRVLALCGCAWQYASHTASCIASLSLKRKKAVLMGKKLRTEMLMKQMDVVHPLEKQLQKVAYFLILSSWFCIVWVLLTYGMLIRQLLGNEEQSELIRVWAMTLAAEMFGAETIKLVAIRIMVDMLMQHAEEMFLGLNVAQRWYEGYIVSKSRHRQTEDEQAGDQDLGDDADADGGDAIGEDQEDIAMHL